MQLPHNNKNNIRSELNLQGFPNNIFSQIEGISIHEIISYTETYL